MDMRLCGVCIIYAGLLCYEARLEQFDHFNLVSKWPLYLYLLKFPHEWNPFSDLKMP